MTTTTKHNRTFQISINPEYIDPRYQFNACVGDNGGPYNLADYGNGYFEGAQEISKAILSGHYKIDLLIYPACFCFRQGIELYAKSLHHGFTILGIIEERRPPNHNLSFYWGEIQKAIKALDEGGKKLFPTEERDFLNEIMKDFSDIDPSGQAFRYPKDTREQQHLTELGIINTAKLAKRMEITHTYLQEWNDHLAALIYQNNKIITK